MTSQPPSTKRLQGKVSIVTGAASGIGRAISLAYAREGATVVVSDIRPSSTAPNEQDATTVDLIRKQHGEDRALFVSCNVTSASSVNALVQHTVERFGRLDIFVNNAGVAAEARRGQPPQPIWEMTDEIFDTTVDINIKGVFYGSRAAARQFLKQDPHPSGDRGWIINLSSVFGQVAVPGASAYVTSKHAVIGSTKAVALDLAPHRVHVNAICPGYTNSTLTAPSFAQTEGLQQMVAAQHPFRGLGEPEDIAGVALFLASDDARWMSGSCVTVDGAFSIQ